MNNAPFYVGQRVVRVVASPYGKIGDKHTILGVHECVACKLKVVDIGHKENVNFFIGVCSSCGHRALVRCNIAWYDAKSFAPIEPMYADCRAELASQVEVGDTADQPVRVLSN